MEPENDHSFLVVIKPEPMDMVLEALEPRKMEMCDVPEHVKESACTPEHIDNQMCMKMEPGDNSHQLTNNPNPKSSSHTDFSVSVLKNKLNARLKSIVGSQNKSADCITRVTEEPDQSADSILDRTIRCNTEILPTTFPPIRTEDDNEEDLIPLSVLRNCLSHDVINRTASSHQSGGVAELLTTKSLCVISNYSTSPSTVSSKSYQKSFCSSVANTDEVDKQKEISCPSGDEFGMHGETASFTYSKLPETVPSPGVPRDLHSSLHVGLAANEDKFASSHPAPDKIKNELHDDFEDENLQDAATLQNIMNAVSIKTELTVSEEVFTKVDNDNNMYDESINESIHDDDSLLDDDSLIDDDSLLDDSLHESFYSEEGNQESLSTGSSFGATDSFKAESTRSNSVLSGSNTGSGDQKCDYAPTEAQQMKNIDKNKPSTGPLMKECRWSYSNKKKYSNDKVVIMDTSSISIERRVYLPRHKRPPHTCYICSEILPSKEALNEHRKSHKGKGAYSCEQCGKNFHSVGNKNMHMKYHQNKRCYQCDQCDKFYISYQAFKNHMLIHEKGGKFKCEECGRSFLFRSSWFSHRRAHSGENIHECWKCGKCFLHDRSLTNHMTLVHERPKVVACEDCGKRVRASGLERHKDRRHRNKPKKCQICTKVFTDPQEFQIHFRSHDDETLFNCPCCDKKYTQRERWRYHVGYHHGLKVSSKEEIDLTCNENGEEGDEREIGMSGSDIVDTRPKRYRRSCRNRPLSYREHQVFM